MAELEEGCLIQKFKEFSLLLNLIDNDLHARFFTWVSMLVRGLILLILITYAGGVLDPLQSTVFLLLLSILSLHGILDLGFVPTFIRIIAYVDRKRDNRGSLMIAGFDYSETKIDDIRIVFEWIYLRLTILFLVLIVGIGTAALLTPIGRMDDSNIGWASWVITVVGGLYLFTNTRYAAILTGCNRIALQRALEVLVGVPILLLIGLSYYFQLSYFWMVVLFNLNYAVLYLLTKHQVSRIFPNRAKDNNSNKPNRKLVNNIFRSAWRSGVGVLMTMGTITGSGLIVAQLASPLEASSYLLAQRLAIAIGGYCYVPFQVIIPKISSFYASGNVTLLLCIAEKARRQVTLLVILFGFGVLLVTEVGLPYIDYSFRFVSLDLWLVMMIYVLVERAGATNMQLQSVNNKIKWHISNGVGGAIMILSMPFFFGYFGVLGMPISFLFGYLGFVYPYSIYQRIKAFGTFNMLDEIKLIGVPLSLILILRFYIV